MREKKKKIWAGRWNERLEPQAIKKSYDRGFWGSASVTKIVYDVPGTRYKQRSMRISTALSTACCCVPYWLYNCCTTTTTVDKCILDPMRYFCCTKYSTTTTVWIQQGFAAQRRYTTYTYHTNIEYDMTIGISMIRNTQCSWNFILRMAAWKRRMATNSLLSYLQKKQGAVWYVQLTTDSSSTAQNSISYQVYRCDIRIRH